jgi:anti-sigma-K factor RskA
LPPVTPSAKVWTGIEQRLFATRAVAKTHWWQQFGWGTALVGGLLIAGASALITSQVINQRDSTAPAAMLVAALSDSAGVTSVLLRIDPAGNERRALVSVAVVRPAQLTAAQALELWAIAPGAAPRSLGLLPSAQSAAFRARGTVNVNDTLAISIEPAGGSTTGAPTGPVILQGKPRLL